MTQIDKQITISACVGCSFFLVSFPYINDSRENPPVHSSPYIYVLAVIYKVACESELNCRHYSDEDGDHLAPDIEQDLLLEVLEPTHVTNTESISRTQSTDCIRFVESVRGNPLLEMEGQMFTLNRKKLNTYYWECVKKRNKVIKCNARVVTIDGCVKSVRGMHNHDTKMVAQQEMA